MFSRKSCQSAFAAVAFSLMISTMMSGTAKSDEHDGVVAVVNGTEIHLSEVRQTAAGLAEQYRQVPFEKLYPHLLDRVIAMHLIVAEARKTGLDQDADYLRMRAYNENRLLEQALLTKKVMAGLSDEAVQARYETFAAEQDAQEEVHARHILVATNEDAIAIIAELNGGADFTALAMERSTGPSGPQGGDLGFFGMGQMVPAFETAAFALEAGTFTQEPVETQFGWHIIKSEARRIKPVPALDEVGDQLREELAREIEAGFIETLQSAATVERFNMDGTPLAAPTAP